MGYQNIRSRSVRCFCRKDRARRTEGRTIFATAKPRPGLHYASRGINENYFFRTVGLWVFHNPEIEITVSGKKVPLYLLL